MRSGTVRSGYDEAGISILTIDDLRSGVVIVVHIWIHWEDGVWSWSRGRWILDGYTWLCFTFGESDWEHDDQSDGHDCDSSNDGILYSILLRIVLFDDYCRLIVRGLVTCCHVLDLVVHELVAFVVNWVWHCDFWWWMRCFTLYIIYYIWLYHPESYHKHPLESIRNKVKLNG